MLNASIAYITDREEKESCPMFGEDDIQGKKHALMTGNKVNYLFKFEIKRLRHCLP